jgi:UDP-glucose 4-epimerase
VALTGKRVVITGGAGFIGTTLARRLVDENEIVAVDNLHRDSLGGTSLAEHANFSFVQGDVLDTSLLGDAVRGATHLVHAAAIAGVDTVIESPVRTMRVNLIGTYNALEAALATNDTIERVIEFSTSEVFGTYAFKVDESHVTTQGSVGEARWTYAVSKLAGEHMAHAYHDELCRPSPSARSTSTGRARSAAGPSGPSSRRPSPANSSSSTATGRRSARGATWTTWSTRSCSRSSIRTPSARASTSATRAPR